MKKLIALILALAAALLSGCAREDAAVQEAPELLEPVGVRTDYAVAARRDMYTISVYEGSVVATAEELSFDIDGVIGEVLCYPGKWVEEGEALFKLDQEQLGRDIESLRRQIDYAESDGIYEDALAQIDIDIMEMELEEMRLSGAGEEKLALKEADIAQAKTDMRQAKELRDITLKAQKSELEELLKDYGRNVLYAPFSGNVFYLDALNEGTQVRASRTVAYIANPNDLFLEVNTYLPEQRFDASRCYALIGSRKYTLSYRPMSREDMTSVILSGGSLKTRFDIVGPEEDLDEIGAGMYAVLCVEGKRVDDALCIPSGAIYTAAGDRYVYVITDAGRVRRTVTTGFTDGMNTQITSGLEEGERVYVKE